MAPENLPTEPDNEQSPSISWALLLTRWTEFARSAVALPPEGEGKRWRESVAPIIGLQAVTLAVGELRLLDPADRPLALDMADVLVRRHAAELNQAWRGQEMPERLLALMEDARQAVERAGSAGLEWRWEGPGELVVPDLTPWARVVIEAGFRGEALAAAPRTVLFPGEPVAFLRPTFRGAPAPIGGLVAREGPGRQVYRRMEPSEGVVDLVAPFEAPLPPGRPLLAPLIKGRDVIARWTEAEAREWLEAQRKALDGKAARVESLDISEKLNLRG